MSVLPPILVELKANAGEFMAKMGEARAEVSKLGTESAGHVQKFSAIGKAALLGFAGVAVGVGTIAVHAALEGQQAHAALAQAIKNTGGSMEDVAPKVEALAGKFAKLGFTNDELEQGLTVLTTSLRSPEKAMQNIGLAADLARYKHISLSDASLLVAKAMEGQLRPLKALGIDLPVTAGGAAKLAAASQHLKDAQEKLTAAQDKAAHTTGPAHKRALEAVAKAQEGVEKAQRSLNAVQATSNVIVDGLTKAVGGQASAAADTYAGKLQAAKAQVENLAEKLGNALLPIIAQVVSKVSDAVDWFEKHRAITETLAAVIGTVLVGAITAYVYQLAKGAAENAATMAKDLADGAGWVATKAAQFATVTAAGVAASVKAMAGWAVSLGADIASGVRWVGMKIAQYVAVSVAAVASAAASAAAWIAANMAMILATGGIILAIGLLIAAGYFLVKHWSTVWGWIKEAAGAAWHYIEGVATGIGNAFKGLWENLLRPIFKMWIDVWFSVIGAILNGAAHAFGWIPGLGGKLKAAAKAFNSFRDEVNAALGGIHDRNVTITAAMKNQVAVGGSTAAIRAGFAKGTDYAPGGLAVVGERGPELVDLPRGAKVYPNGTGPGGGGGDIHVTIAGPVYGTDSRELAVKVRQALLELRRSSGQSLAFT